MRHLAMRVYTHMLTGIYPALRIMSGCRRQSLARAVAASATTRTRNLRAHTSMPSEGFPVFHALSEGVTLIIYSQTIN